MARAGDVYQRLLAERNRRLIATHPLVQDGNMLIPSITKVFRKDQDLYVFFEVYDPGDPAAKTANIAATVSFFRGKLKAFESEPVNIARPVERGNTAAVPFKIPLARLAAGSCTCQVNVVDELGKKFAFRRSSFVLLPGKDAGVLTSLQQRPD